MEMLIVVGWLVSHTCTAGPMPLAAAAGIVANFERESGPRLDPSAHSRLGIGLPAWAGPRRRQMLAALGARWSDGFAQLDYMIHEKPWLVIRERLCVEHDPATAAAIFFSGFEWPGRKRTPEKTLQRARTIYQEMAR